MYIAEVFVGIKIAYISNKDEWINVDNIHMLRVDYCKTGRVSINGDTLHSGDFAAYSICDASVKFPISEYEGITVFIDTNAVSAEFFNDTDIFECLEGKFCNGKVNTFAENKQIQHIFSEMYQIHGKFKLQYLKLKVAEMILTLSQLSVDYKPQSAEFRPEHIDAVREIHDNLLTQINRRITIEELSKKYLINPTTLKAAFKSVYGTSVAAHMKEHRMEYAKKLLKDTELSVAEIAKAVGYDSQSKFTTAFAAFSGITPRDYRKNQ